MEAPWLAMGYNLGAIVLFMSMVWGLSVVLKNASIVDGFWGPGFVLVAWLTWGTGGGYGPRGILVAVLVTLWGGRLAAHIALRNRGHGEDRRYAAWRARHGPRFWWVSFFTVFMVQALFLWIISLSIQMAGTSPRPAQFTWLDGLGTLVWTAGFLVEAVADHQLSRFKKRPENAGKVMREGLWAYSRHPNYFGECLAWWGIFLVALSTPYGWWVLISPATITVLLLKVSGVTLLERNLLETRPSYREYMRATSAFVPWPPRKDPS